MGFIERARDLGVEFERRPVERVVITGFHQFTALGETLETWEGLLAGRSGVGKIEVGNEGTKIGAPVGDKFKPEDFFPPHELRSLSRIGAMAIVSARKAGLMAQILGGDKRILPGLDKDRIGSWIGSGIYATHNLIDINEILKEGGRLKPSDVLRVFPEQLNAQVGIRLGYSGWPGSTTEACATGAANIIEGCGVIKAGKADVIIAGGFEELLDEHGDVGVGIFSALRALSTRNGEPEKASRPYDRKRDGFVMASGGGVVVLESLESAQLRKARIYAEVTGFEKSMDGFDTTKLDSRRVAKTILQALYDKKLKEFQKVDAIFAHETSTPFGDLEAAKALALAFGEDLKNIPVTAIKSMLGHLIGGAGAVNVVNAILAIQEGKIPQILNLDNPDPEITKETGGMLFVRGKPLERELNKVLATAFGFGGYNAAVVLSKYNP